MRMYVFPCFLPIIMMVGCATGKVLPRQDQSLPTEELQLTGLPGSENKIVFLTIRITLADSVKDTYQFKITHKTIANGQLKRNVTGNFQPDPTYLFCEIMDSLNQRLDFIRVDNPLFRVYEFNEKPESPLEKKTFIKTQGEFNLRFQLDKNTKYLSIFKISPDYKTLKRIYHATILH